ncbi:hypothetical protein NUU61_003393 [Penicillium alfredii]|uniref:Protein efr3 n=1 Tax=Penicillium alfredii TaxID=1506179 RepID=A0A9W9FT91_9EURO|nr:uncharacterized protein NUU61_003393 [Penicillium alfredii]KAJ5106046.1 hypothetical protein NUU61_003393 [Penicillium alfredii]
MESVRQSCRPKHQVLTLKCYPRYQKGVSEVKPNPSELSYLLYYTSTRRSKLTKVGAFLEKRVARDVWRRRIGNVQVALHILTALIEKVPRDLPIYARSVLTVIETVLRSNDITMVEDSIATFEMFCRTQDMAAIAAEQGLANQYREVVRTYANLADPTFQSQLHTKLSPPVAIRWRNAGLRAIKGVVSSESLAADGGNSLKTILPVILENLYSGEEDILVTLKEKLQEAEKPERDRARPRRLSVTTVHTVDTAEGDPTLAARSPADADRQAEMDARLLALRCLEQIIVSGSNRGQTRIAATIILRFLSTKGLPRTASQDQSGATKINGNWATSLIELIANWCPVQVRFVILVTAMEILRDTSPKEDALKSSFTLLYVVDWLLKSSVNMIGLSVMDILFGLMHYASEILSHLDQPARAETEEKQDEHADKNASISPQRKNLLTLLEQCIGDLATHIYYGDQVADMMRAILRRYKPTLNHESSSPSALATVHETGAVPVDPANSAAEINGEKTSGDTFSHTTAKLTALRSVKAILVVANLRTPAATAGVESRNPVGIHVWEGTQGLLRDSNRDVRYAYADALLSWLHLETNKGDLKARVETPKFIKSPSKRDSDQGDKLNRRSVSGPVNQREKVMQAAQSNFLRLLHLAIYDAAHEGATDESEILFLHLLLATLVENLGVNAAQFGIPMVLRLQDDLFTAVDLGSFTARVNIGSLVHGYFLSLSEKFNLISSPVGVEICNEVEKRQNKSQWLTKVQTPPVGLDDIAFDDENRSANSTSDSPPLLMPFRNVEGLVSYIDEAYRLSITSPPQSPPTSPARGFSFPVLNHVAAPQLQPDGSLPYPVKEQMMSSWSRDSCLAAVEKESVRTLSISGSRVGTLNARNGHANGVANGSPNGSALNQNRRMSVPEITSTPAPSSSRGSPVRVNELRRVLSVSNDAHPRRLSPLRGRADTSNASILSSDSESLLSGAFSVSEVDGDAASVQPQDRQHTPDGDGMETPRAAASAVVLAGDKTPIDNSQQTTTLSRVNSDEIPPVPPIPAGLAIPGGFPNDSQRSLVSVDRPSTAPGLSRQSSLKSKSDSIPAPRNTKSLNRNKSRSSNSLVGGVSPTTAVFPDLSNETNGTDAALDQSHRDHLRQLLDGFLSPHDGALPNGDHRPATAQPSSKGPLSGSRRQVSMKGIGRPPY